jgi:hypothetical protein
MAAGYGLMTGVQFSAGERHFSVLTAPGAALVSTQSFIVWAPEAISQELKRQGREADQSPPSIAQSKKCEAVPPLPNMSSYNSF